MLLANNTEQQSTEKCESAFTRFWTFFFWIFSNAIDLSSYNIHNLDLEVRNVPSEYY